MIATMKQIFIFLMDLYLLYARLATLHITNIGSSKKLNICIIIDKCLKLSPMYFLLTKLEDFVQKHFFSAKNG